MSDYEQWLLGKIEYHKQASLDYERLENYSAALMHHHYGSAYQEALRKYKGSE